MNGLSRYTVDYGVFAQEMGNLIDENVVDADLKAWVLPDFSTTTASDRIVASILLMGVTQKYFEYVCSILCGLPSVTLLGEKADWENIYARLGKLEMYGNEPKMFCRVLRPVVARFVKSFEEPESEDVIGFWQRIATTERVGSGSSAYTGWITAFCFWNSRGSCIYHGRYLEGSLGIDGVKYPKISSDAIPAGYATVPVTIDDNGHIVESMMIAGSVGVRPTYTNNGHQEEGTSQNTINPEVSPLFHIFLDLFCIPEKKGNSCKIIKK